MKKAQNAIHFMFVVVLPSVHFIFFSFEWSFESIWYIFGRFCHFEVKIKKFLLVVHRGPNGIGIEFSTYLDDIYIFRTLLDHLEHVRTL